MCKDISFSIDKSFYQPIKGLNDEMLGKLFRAIFEYQVNNKTDCEPEITMPFQFFVAKFEQDAITKRLSAENGAKGGRPAKSKKASLEQGNAINNIYDAYPAKCPIKGNNTGKCAKNKEQVALLLQTHSETELIKTIQNYVSDCKQSSTYIKNFGTFLNNLPDLEASTNTPESEKRIKWMITSLQCEHKGLPVQMEQDKKVYGESNVQFLGYVY